MDKKLVVIFPGIGYHSDKPLLYYSKKAAKKHDYEIIEVSYDLSAIDSSDKGNEEKMAEALQSAYEQAAAQLYQVKFNEYSRVVFIGKSIGTAVAARFNSSYMINAEQIVFTPIPATFTYINNCEGLLFHGSADPYCDTSLIADAGDALSLTYAIIPEANHSLETGDVMIDIENLGIIIRSVEKILA